MQQIQILKMLRVQSIQNQEYHFNISSVKSICSIISFSFINVHKDALFTVTHNWTLQ